MELSWVKSLSFTTTRLMSPFWSNTGVPVTRRCFWVRVMYCIMLTCLPVLSTSRVTEAVDQPFLEQILHGLAHHLTGREAVELGRGLVDLDDHPLAVAEQDGRSEEMSKMAFSSRLSRE